MAVLTSAGITFGDATTQSTAATAAALVTTANVLSATAGASFAAVGTYAFLSRSDNSFTAGGTTAGSNLRAGSVQQPCGTTVVYGAALQSGTWRAMGTTNATPNITVWLRIS